MKVFFTALLQCSLSMSVITLLYYLALPVLSKRYASKWRYTIWLVISVGWLIPFRPIIELPFLPAQSADTPLMPMPTVPVSPAINTPVEVLANAPYRESTIPPFSMWEFGFFLWLAGVIFLLIYHIWRHRRFMKMVHRWSEAETSPETLLLLNSLKEEEKIKSHIEYKICSSISCPMMVGFFRPVILMPPIQLSENELTLILRHELIHFKRHDLWYKALVLAATILHWFNPVVHFMARATSVQCEISCDSLILKNEDMQVRMQYGEAILAVARGNKTQQTLLSTNFYGGKRGMKNRIISILDSKRKRTGITILCIVLAGILLTGATLVAAVSRPTSIPGTAFTEDEYGKLLALQFDGYEDMSVSEFQQKVWKASDTEEYMELLDRFYQDEQIDSLKDTNPIASFLHYELIPLTAENWKSRQFGGYGMTNYENAASDTPFEYTCTLNITDASSLTVGEYSKARKGVIDGLMTFFQSQMDLMLGNEATTSTSVETQIDTKIDTIAKTWSSDGLTLLVDYFFQPLTPTEGYENTGVTNDKEIEKREYSNGTAEDYNSLLKLKTEDYKSQTVAAFNETLLDWGNANFDRMERISGDVGINDYAVALTPEDLSFATLTVRLSNTENATMIRSERTGEPENPGFGGDPLIKEVNDNTGLVYCSLYYQMSYHIPDKSRITVGERDRCVGGVINAIQSLWDSTDIEELLSMSQTEVIDQLQDFAKQYSNDLITINFNPTKEGVSFEQMDERSILD